MKSMINFKTLIENKENNIHSGYRWWMEPNGTIHSTNGKTHPAWVFDYLKKYNLNPPIGFSITFENTVDRLFKMGWIRLILVGDSDYLILEYEYDTNKPISIQNLKNIKDFAIELGAKEIHDDCRNRYQSLNESPDISIQNKSVMAGNSLLKGIPVEEVKENIVVFRNNKSGIFAEGHTFIYFMDSEESAKEMSEGNIPYLIVPRGSIYSGGNPITDVWKKKYHRPGNEHILGIMEGNTNENQIYIDMLTVRPGFTRNSIATKLLQTIKNHFPNAKISTSSATNQGEKFLKTHNISPPIKESSEWNPKWMAWWMDPSGKLFPVYTKEYTKGHFQWAKDHLKNIEHARSMDNVQSPDSILMSDGWIRLTYNYYKEGILNFEYSRLKYPNEKIIGLIKSLAIECGAKGLHDDIKNNYVELLEVINENQNKKLIVYHGTDKEFKKFNLDTATQGIIWFSSDKQSVINREVGAQGNGYIIEAEVTINNPAGWDEYDKYSLGELRRNKFDGAILPKENNQFDCFVFSPSQIKILKIEETNKLTESYYPGEEEYWWMDKNLNFHEVPFEGHEEWAINYLDKIKFQNKSNTLFFPTDEIYPTMYKLGFIRITKIEYSENIWSLAFNYDKNIPLTHQQIKALKDWAIENGCELITDDTLRKTDNLNEIKYTDNMSDDEKDDLENSYFSIGQEHDEDIENNYCWLYRSNLLYVKKGGTHAMNFGVTDRDICFRGWFDIEKNAISVVFPPQEEKKLNGRRPTEDDIPQLLYKKLISQFGKRKPKFFIFENINKSKLLNESVDNQWWMDTSLKFHETEYQDHKPWAEAYLRKLRISNNYKKLFNGVKIDGVDVYKIMYELGFVRVVKSTWAEGGSGLFYQYKKDGELTYRQIKALKDWAIENQCNYIFDDNKNIETLLTEIRLEPSIELDNNLNPEINETMTYKQLLDLTTDERKQRSTNVRVRSIPVSVENGLEEWNFRYKSSPTTTVTNKPFEGKITFLKGEVDQNDDTMDLDCKVDCSCPDYKYKFAYNNAKQDAGEIGNDSLNKCINRSPQPAYDIGEGLCKHLAALRNYLKSKITNTRQNNLFETLNDITKEGPFNITYYD